jgi:hypothetical protein
MIITAIPSVTPRIEITVITETNERFGFKYRRARKRENREVTWERVVRAGVEDGVVLVPQSRD